MEGGCTWRTPQCDQISTIAEAEAYVGRHSTECIFNPTVVEERIHWRQMEAEEVACRAAAEERREAAESEEHREEREYQRRRAKVREVEDAKAEAERRQTVEAAVAACDEAGEEHTRARPTVPKPGPTPRSVLER